MKERDAPKVDSDTLLGQYIPLHYHGQMLLSEDRMSAFETAIARVVPVGARVVDLGGGTGVLSFFAARAGASVVCVERLPHVAKAAQRFLAQNGVADRVTVVESDARDYTPEEPVDIVICEMLHSALLREKQVEIIAGFKQRYLERFGGALPRFIPEATLLAVQPVEQPFDFHGYHAPVTLFYEAGSVYAPTIDLGPPFLYATIDYATDFGASYVFDQTLTLERDGVVNALRFVTKNLIAILPDEGRSIDWHMQYLIAPLATPLRGNAGTRVRVRFGYDAGDSIEALLASMQIELAAAL